MYPGPEPRVPVNKPGYRTWEELSHAEAIFVAKRAKTIPSPAGELTYKGFKALHGHLFQDIYEWAGQERTYTTGRNREVPFAAPQFISTHMEQQFRKFEFLHRFVGLSTDQFSRHAADFINEVNAAHSFIEGNGRVQRLFLQMVSANAGYSLSLRGADMNAWNHAAKVGFLAGDTSLFVSLISSRITPIPPSPGPAVRREVTRDRDKEASNPSPTAQKTSTLDSSKSTRHPSQGNRSHVMSEAMQAEFTNRVKYLPELDNSMGPSYTLAKHSLRALQKSEPSKVNWDEVHKKTIVDSIQNHGQDPDEVFEAICKFSPGAVTEDVQNRIKSALDSIAPDLARSYDQARQKEDADYAAEKAANGGQIKFKKA